jgi:hypothetical protein
MNTLEREQTVKLHLLTSLARSQRALTRMIESCADVCEGSEDMSRRVAEHIRVIADYQQQLTEKITSIRILHLRKGPPGKPWMNDRLVTAGSGSSSHRLRKRTIKGEEAT